MSLTIYNNYTEYTMRGITTVLRVSTTYVYKFSGCEAGNTRRQPSGRSCERTPRPPLPPRGRRVYANFGQLERRHR